ncbi:MAG TPA: DUF58 domain-containing protein [Planctomycetes bacterium]|nr:DUF58 domain-containing protein [Planctomycetota bacterium]
MKPRGAPEAGQPEALQEILAEVRRIEAQSRVLVSGVMAGGYHSCFRGSGVEFEEIREFAEGDDPRSIDSSVTAKMGRPFVKVFVEERERSLLFLLDLSASMGSREGAWTARQMAARITACLALSAHRNDDRVGLLRYGPEVLDFAPPKKGLDNILRILRDILQGPAAPGRARLASALEFAGRSLRRPATILILSDLLGEDPGEWESPLALCAKKHELLLLRISPPEPSFRGGGLYAIQDPETGERRILDLGSPRVRKALTQAQEAFRRRCDQRLLRHGVELLDFEIPETPDMDPVVRPILSFFRKREKRRRR